MRHPPVQDHELCISAVFWEVHQGVDFCIYSSRVLHLVRVDEGLSRVAQMGGQLNMAKCHIGETQVTLLGHVVSGASI